MDKKTNLIWLDLEMTGLDPQTNKIIEIATIVTDANLNVIATGPELAIKQSDADLAAMDNWCTKQHANSGLTARVRASNIDETTAEKQTLDFLKQHVAPKASPMCGNSICMDRRFLYQYMPKLEAFFHYRNLDVSTLKILAQNWSAEFNTVPQKKNCHRALDDIKESISEMLWYKSNFLRVNK